MKNSEKYKTLLPVLFFVCLMSGCRGEKAKTDEGASICYYNYRLLENYLLAADDTIFLKLGDSIMVYMVSSDVLNENYWQLSVSHGSPLASVVPKSGGYMVTATGTGGVKAGVLSGQESLLFYIDIYPVNTEIVVYETPVYQIDAGHTDLKNEIRKELDSLYAVRLLDEFDLTYTTTQGTGSVKFYNKLNGSIQEPITGTFKEEGSKMSLYFDNQTEYNFSFEQYEPASSIFSHYLYQDFTDFFQSKYPLEEINKVLVIAKCHRTSFE